MFLCHSMTINMHLTPEHPRTFCAPQALSCMPRLHTLGITGCAAFWLPMGQHLLVAQPHIAHLHLVYTSGPGEFVAAPLGPCSTCTPAASPAAASSGGGGAAASGLGGSVGSQGQGQAHGWGPGQTGAGAGPAACGRLLRTMVRHVDNARLLDDARQLLPLQPGPRDEVTLEICGMGEVSGAQGGAAAGTLVNAHAAPDRSCLEAHGQHHGLTYHLSYGDE